MSKFSYDKAQEELEEILIKLENNEISIDQLKSTVEKAQLLVAKCRNRLQETEDAVKKLVANSDEEHGD